MKKILIKIENYIFSVSKTPLEDIKLAFLITNITLFSLGLLAALPVVFLITGDIKWNEGDINSSSTILLFCLIMLFSYLHGMTKRQIKIIENN